MHAVFITYTTSASLEDVREPYTEYARALGTGQIRGFVSKTWLHNGNTHGGFHLFQDREAADLYLVEMFEPDVAASPDISDIRIERFEVNEELSTLTNGVPGTAGAAV